MSTHADLSEVINYALPMTLKSKPQIKRRDAGATRAKLLDSARMVFTQKGYEGAGLRQICRNAGVDQALVKRYFGSKQKLFEAVFDTGLGLHEILTGPKEKLGAEIADYYINKSVLTVDHSLHGNTDISPDNSALGFDPTIALLHSIGSSEVNGQLKHIIESQFIDRLALLIGGRQAKQRAALIVSHILGFDVLRRVLGVEAMGSAHKTILKNTWARQIQMLVDDE